MTNQTRVVFKPSFQQKLRNGANAAGRAAVREAAQIAQESMERDTPVLSGHARQNVDTINTGTRARIGWFGDRVPYAGILDARHRIRRRAVGAIRRGMGRIRAAAKQAARRATGS